MDYPILNEVNVPQVFGPFLDQYSATVSTRNIVCEPIRTTTTRNGVTTVNRTVRFRLGSRILNTSSYIPTVSTWDSLTGHKQELTPIELITNGFKVKAPIWTVPHALLNDPTCQFLGSCLQEAGGNEYVWNYPTTTSSASLFITSRKTQYEFMISNTFPADWTLEQIKTAIENNIPNSCLWIIKWGVALIFAVTPQRVIADIRRTNSAINTTDLLETAIRVERTFTLQPSDRIQNIFPRLAVEGNKIINKSIINGDDWKTKKGIKSSSGQTLNWKWVVGLFNDKKGDGPWSNVVGPSIYNIERSDWEFMDWDACTEFELIDSDTEVPRIDTVNKKIYFSSNRRVVFTLQLRQLSTDKGEDYIGYTSLDNFYTDSLAWFVKNKLIQ